MGVYIAEAHAKDEWPMPCVNTPCRHLQPTSIEQRAAHVKEFVENFRPPFPVVMDSFEDGWKDPFMSTFSAWPERFYIFQCDDDGLMRLRWWNMPCPEEGHRIDDIRDWLQVNGVERPQENGIIPPVLKRTTSEAIREETRLAKVKDVFQTFDAEGKGRISKDRMEALFESLGYLPETLGAVFEEVDIDRSGEVSLEEFEAFFRSVHPSLQKELGKQGRLDHVAGPRAARPHKVAAAA